MASAGTPPSSSAAVDTEVADLDARASADPRPLPQANDRIGRYVVLEEIGGGAMGVVFSAYDPELDRKIALKLVQPRLGAFGGEEVQRRLLREAQGLARLHHPNVVTVHDVGTVGDAVFVAMEFVQGRSLREWLAAQPRGQAEIVAAFLDVGRGLAAAHAKEMVHRDVKPDNVMVTDEGRIVVVDFGLVRAADPATLRGEGPAASRSTGHLVALDDHLELTDPGDLLGTPGYMSPEQFSGTTVTAASDQFSFCVALYEALFGGRPFPGRTIGEIAAAMLTDDRAAILRRRPTWLARILYRGLAADPSHRYPSMGALLVDLSRNPARRGRWIAASALALLLPAGVAALHQARLTEQRDACDRAAAQIESAWNPGIATEVGAAVIAAGPAYAGDTWSRVSVRLDDLAARWREVRGAACMAQSEADPGAPAFAPIERCLDGQRAALHAFVDATRGSDANMVAVLIRSAWALPEPESCTDELEGARTPVSPEGETGVRAEALRLRLARVRADSVLGRVDEATQEATRIVDDAAQIGWGPLLAEAWFELAAVHLAGNALAPARAAGKTAFEHALRSRHDTIALRAATVLGSAAALQGELAASRDGLELATLLLERLRIDNGAMAAALAGAWGLLEDVSGHPLEARRHFEASLESSLRSFGPQHPSVAGTLQNLASAQTNAGDHAAAADSLARARAILERAVGPDHPTIGMLLLADANVRRARGDVAGALPLLEDAHRVLTAALGPEDLEAISAEYMLAVVHAELGDPTRATSAFEHVLEVRQRVLGEEHPEVARAYRSLAHARASATGDMRAALPLLERALTIEQRSLGTDSVSLVPSLQNLGVVYLEIDELEPSEQAFTRAIAIVEGALGRGHPDLGPLLDDLGVVLLRRGDCPRALAAFERAVAVGDAKDADLPERRTSLANARSACEAMRR